MQVSSLRLLSQGVQVCFVKPHTPHRHHTISGEKLSFAWSNTIHESSVTGKVHIVQSSVWIWSALQNANRKINISSVLAISWHFKGVRKLEEAGNILYLFLLLIAEVIFLLLYFLPSVHGIQLVVTVLSHCCNSRTDSREGKVESRESSETQPNQATLLLDTMPT